MEVGKDPTEVDVSTPDDGEANGIFVFGSSYRRWMALDRGSVEAGFIGARGQAALGHIMCERAVIEENIVQEAELVGAAA